MSDAFRERRVSAQDGLGLYVRDYGDALWARTPVICLPGLTRNSKDFAALAGRLAGGAAPRRVLCPDFRGRGRSDYDSSGRSYTPPTYLLDVQAILAALDIHRVVVVGTSLGGVIAMLLATVQPTVLAGVVLNDIGPEVPDAAIARIAGYASSAEAPATWDAAAAELRKRYDAAYPDADDAEWARVARFIFREDANGHVVFDYDPALARSFGTGGSAPKIWRLFEALHDIPTLALRGELSDVLTAATFDAMAQAKPDLVRVTVPRRGHSPLLDEPAAVAAIDAFLAGR